MHRVALTLILMSACADGGDEGFHIIHNLAAPMDCLYKPGGAFISHGSIVSTSPEPYRLHPELESRISVVDGQNPAQRTIALRGARVEVSDAQTGAAVGKFTSLFAASLTPMGKTAVSFDIITPEMLRSVGATGDTRVELVAKVVAYGAMGGTGDEIDSVPFFYPVTVCETCLAVSIGRCPLPFDTEIPSGNPCHLYQDGLTACCTDDANQLVCPPTIAPPPAQ